VRRTFIVVALAIAAFSLTAGQAWAVSGAGYTTVNTAADGPNHCKNGNPGVNCNIYDGKQYVWLNGGPAANGLGPDGQYFFAVLAPGGQPNPNDGGAKNLSDDFDAYTNRTFTVTNGEVSAYGGTHDSAIPLIRLFPYADTTNPGGVYIMAICSLDRGYPVEPRDCKYDAFKVKVGAAKVQAVLSGTKYFDANKNGQRDPGEAGLSNWVVTIQGTDGTNTTVTTNAAGDWSYTTTAHTPSAGTTTYTLQEVQQAGWTQTGNTVDQSVTAGGATVALANFVYTVTVPNNAVSAVEQLNFGNFKDKPPVCPPPTFGVTPDGHNFLTVTVQDADTGLADIDITWSINTAVDVPPFYGSKDPITVTATQIDLALNWGLEFVATDLAGNQTTCDPVVMTLVRESGRSSTQTFTGLSDVDSKVTVTNGERGVRSVSVVVNGRTFRVSGLASGETRTIDVASAMLAGHDNTISVTARGAPGSSATIVISN
jgi:hypothetical protein